MRRALATALLLGALAMPAAAPAGPTTGIKGVVYDTTCPGPCRIPPPPPHRFTGDGLTVKIRDLTAHETVALLHPKNGRFRAELPPGRYRVRAFVGDPGKPNCWDGDRKRVEVVDGFTHVRLHVNNGCVV